MANEYQERKEEKEDRIRRSKRRRFVQRVVWIFGIVVIVGGFLVWLAWMAKQPSAPGETPGTFYPSVGRDHIGLADEPPTPYNSNPPSSGAHFGQPANWGIYDYEVNDKIIIHNLEHGGVWVAYNASTTPSGVVDDLKAIVSEFGGSKIVMAPRSANDADVAIAAWTRVQKFDLNGAGRLSDEQKNMVRAFYKAYKDHGPEFVPDSMPGVDPKSVQ